MRSGVLPVKKDHLWYNNYLFHIQILKKKESFAESMPLVGVLEIPIKYVCTVCVISKNERLASVQKAIANSIETTMPVSPYGITCAQIAQSHFPAVIPENTATIAATFHSLEMNTTKTYVTIPLGQSITIGKMDVQDYGKRLEILRNIAAGEPKYSCETIIPASSAELNHERVRQSASKATITLKSSPAYLTSSKSLHGKRLSSANCSGTLEMAEPCVPRAITKLSMVAVANA